MRADICNPDDDAAVQRFRNALQSLGAGISEKSWALGVDVYRFNIGGDELTIFSDAWSIDIEGPDALVQKVLREFNRNVA
jgi:hypothetical protein